MILKRLKRYCEYPSKKKKDTQKLEYTEIYFLCNKASKLPLQREMKIIFMCFLAQKYEIFLLCRRRLSSHMIGRQAVLLAALRQCVSKMIRICLGKFWFQESPRWELGIIIRIYFIKFHLGQVSSTFRFLWNFQTERTNVIGERCSTTEHHRKSSQKNYYFYIFFFFFKYR